MYYIIFHYHDKSTETYSGGSYIFQGDKHACLDDSNPKLYKSKKVAENAAEELFNSCVNTGSSFEVVERIDENA